MIRRGLLATVASCLALLATGAQAQTATAEKCLTAEEVESVVLMLAPGAVRSLQGACAPKLYDDAYLRTKGDALVARFQAAAKDMGPVSDRAIARLAGPGAKTEGPLTTMFLEAMIESAIQGADEKLTPEVCGKIDRAFLLFDPLPARNFSGIIELLVEFGMTNDKGKGEKSPFTLCKPK